MKTLFTAIRIASFLCYSYLYFILKFDLFSCVTGFIIVVAITTPVENKKSEAVTPDF